MTDNKVNENKYIAQHINEANKIAVERLMSVQPVLTDIDTALNVLPGMTPHTILHSGPPITWRRMCDPMKRAVKGALILEGLAKDDKSAEKLMKSKTTHSVTRPHPLGSKRWESVTSQWRT